MSTSSADISLGTIGANAGIPNLNVATVPSNIRTGGSKAMQAYSEGLAFEDMLVSELTQQLATTMYGGSGDSSSAAGSGSGSDGSSSGSSMLGGASAYASMIPSALSSSIMNDGGLGMAESFAQELDPTLLSQASAATGTSAGSGSTTPASGSSTASTTSDSSSGTTTGSARQVML